MSETKKIVWIGEKPEKKVNRLGRDYIFVRGEPTAVPEQVAYNLLQIRSCFATPENAADIVKKLQEEEEQRAAIKQAAAEEALKKDKQNTWKVYVDDEVVSISKYNKAKLDTIILAENLPIDESTIERPEGVPPVEALRMAVRDALHAKSGNPELAEEAKG